MNRLKTLSLLFVLILATGCMQSRLNTKNDEPTESSENRSTATRGAATQNAPIGNYEVEEMKNEITRIAGKLDEIEHQQRSSGAADLRETIAKVESRVVELEKNQILIMTEIKELKDNAANATAPTSVSSKGNTPGATTKNLLADGFTELEAKNYDVATEKFKTFLSKKPKNHDAAEAQYGLGEVEYAQKSYKKAIVEFSKVQELNPKSARVPATLYKIGLCFQRLNMPKESKDFFAELQERYPNSSEAKKARAKTSEKGKQ